MEVTALLLATLILEKIYLVLFLQTSTQLQFIEVTQETDALHQSADPNVCLKYFYLSNKFFIRLIIILRTA